MIGRSFSRIREGEHFRLDIPDFSGGVNTLVSETRLDKKETKEATNMMLDEDGVWTKRWGTAQYGGVSFTATPDGFCEYRKSDGTRQLIVVADGAAYVVDPSAKTKTAISGATFTSGYPCDFAQIKNFLYVVNGQDVMARYNGTSFSTYTGLSTPAWDGTPLTRGAGLSAGSYNYYYRISAVNAVGETLAVAEATIGVNISRDDWDSSTEYLQLDWGDVAGALKYVIYAGDTTGYLGKLTEVSVSTFQDTGALSINYYVEPPTADTTTGPLFRSIAISNSRIWGTNDPNNPQRVHFSGTGVDVGNFSPAYGGGWIDLESGGRATNVKVLDFQDAPHIWCNTAEGTGAIWKISLSSVTIGSTDVIIPVSEKIIGMKGTPAQRSVVLVENDAYFMNIRGVYTFGDEVGVLNRLRTNELSSNIRPYIRDLYQADLDHSCAYYYESKVFFSVPTASGAPNRIIYYDRELKAWVKDWTIGVSQFGEFTDSSGLRHFLGINGTKLVEFSSNYEGDQNVAFTWRYVSPRFAVNKDWSRFAAVNRAYIKLRNTRGSLEFSMSGTSRNEVSTTVGTATISQGSSDTGMGWDLVGAIQMGSTSGVPTLFASQSLVRYVDLDEIVRDLQWSLTGDALADAAVITGISAEGTMIGVASPEDWRLD